MPDLAKFEWPADQQTGRVELKHGGVLSLTGKAVGIKLGSVSVVLMAPSDDAILVAAAALNVDLDPRFGATARLNAFLS